MKKRAKLILFAIVCALLVLFGYEGYRMATAEKGDRFSTSLVEVTIGDRGYAIPRNYLRDVRYDPQTDGDTRAMLRALWPELEPLTRENERYWQRRYPRKQIVIHIVDRGVSGHQRLQNAIKYGLVENEAKPGLFGLMKYSGKKHRFFVSRVEDSSTPSREPMVFHCKDATDATKENFEFEPLCTVDYKLPDGAWLYYNFFMVNLEEWREIDRAVRALVTSFRNGG